MPQKRSPSSQRNKHMRQRLIERFGTMEQARQALLQKTAHRCWICTQYVGIFDVTFDHVHGPSNAWDNLMPAHAACNVKRGSCRQPKRT